MHLHGDDLQAEEEKNQIGRYQICATSPRGSGTQIYLLDTTDGTIWINTTKQGMFDYSFGSWSQLPPHPHAEIPIKMIEPSNN